MSDLDVANRAVYETARERDFQLYMLDGKRKWRDALLRGETGKVEYEEVIRRRDEIAKARKKR